MRSDGLVIRRVPESCCGVRNEGLGFRLPTEHSTAAKYTKDLKDDAPFLGEGMHSVAEVCIASKGQDPISSRLLLSVDKSCVHELEIMTSRSGAWSIWCKSKP